MSKVCQPPLKKGPTPLTYGDHRWPGLASPLRNTPEQQWQCVVDALEWLGNASGDVKNGFSNLVGKLGFDEALAVFGREGAERAKILQTLGERWADFAGLSGRINPLGRESFFDMLATIEPDDVINKIRRNTDGEENLARALNSGKYTKEALAHLRDSFLRGNTYSYEGRTFKFYSDFRPGSNDNIDLLTQIDEIQNYIWDKFGAIGSEFETGRWNCDKCGDYAFEFESQLRDRGIINGRRDTLRGGIYDNVCVDGIYVGVLHIIFIDIDGRVWDPATNTWGQTQSRYRSRVKYIDENLPCHN